MAIDGTWESAQLDPPLGKFAWQGWHSLWHAGPGVHELSCRATDAGGETQPPTTPWDVGGFGNNAVHRVQVTVR